MFTKIPIALKLIAWNCKMAYRKKAALILKLHPDLVIIPECEHPDKLKNQENPTSILWHGDNLHKGLGVFSYNGYTLQLLDVHEPAIKNILPIRVTKGAYSFILLAVWAYNPVDKNYNYIGQVWKAINHYEDLLKNGPVIIAGDFNSNVFWDKLNRKTNHAMVVERLASFNIFSAYHQYKLLEQGKEKHPTFFLYHHKDKPYHLDYCFASASLLQHLTRFSIGKHKDWFAYSDHTPIIASFIM